MAMHSMMIRATVVRVCWRDDMLTVVYANGPHESWHTMVVRVYAAGRQIFIVIQNMIHITAGAAVRAC